MEAWQKVFHDGLVPLLTTEQLEVLREGILKDDPRLGQGFTTEPPPLRCVEEWSVEKTDLIGYCGWFTGLTTVGEIEEFFARTCFEIDQKVGEPAGCRWLLNWYDETPREEMRVKLLVELDLALSKR